MLEAQQNIITSEYTGLYDIIIPKDHFLRRLHDEVDFSFFFEELASKYSEKMGRGAINPIRMMKYTILKVISNLSDVDLMDEVRMNMGYKYFLDMAPEEMPIDPSTLCKFRTQRLKDVKLMTMLISKTLKMAVEKGILKQDVNTGKVKLNLVIDGTHTESEFNYYRPLPGLKKWSCKLRAKMYKYNEELKGHIVSDEDINTLDEEIIYCEKLVERARKEIGDAKELIDYTRVVNRLEELVKDIRDHYTVSADPDARVGHKTADTSFFGYKTSIVIDEESNLIVGAQVTSGEVGDAISGKEVLEEVVNNELIDANEVLGDAAYSGQPILDLAREKGFTMIAPPHPLLGKNIDGRDGFTFNKDANMFSCPQGHIAISSSVRVYKKDNNRKAMVYAFDEKKCSVCKLRKTCLKGKAGFRTFSVTIPSKEQKELLEKSKTDYLKDRLRQRYKIESKNAHLKRRYGYDKAFGKGIKMMDLQSAITCFVSNLKIILRNK
jgi:hypothetical protein